MSPTSQTLSSKKASYTVTVTPVNGSGAALSLGCSGGPANSTCTMSPTSVTLRDAERGAESETD